MKIKFTGNFTQENISNYKNLQDEIQSLKQNNIPCEYENENPLLPSGIKIIIDDSETAFISKLRSWNFLQDEAYSPVDEEKRKKERDLAEKKRIAEAKKAQDEINEKENRPNLIKSLLEMPYVDKTKTELQAMLFEDLTQYHSDCVTKQSKIHELIKIKKEEDIIENWDIEGVKTLEQLELEIKDLKKQKEGE